MEITLKNADTYNYEVYFNHISKIMCDLGTLIKGYAPMTTGTHLHNSRIFADDSVFVSGYTGTSDAAYLQSPLIDLAASAALSMPTAVALTQALFLTEAGTTTAISVADINQGQLGDCFLLSSFGEEALFHPSAITNMIHNNGNGTETVTLYTDRSGHLPTFGSTSFKAATVTINNSFPTNSVDNGAKQDVVGRQKEIWPQVVEKANATFNGGYGAIANGGYPVLAMEELTGQMAASISPVNLTLAALQKYIAAGDLITMDTSSNGGLPYGLVNNHCYMFEKLIGSSGSAMVQLGNPWGFDQPSAIPLSQLSRGGIVEVDIGHTA
jgi:Calpain family cysteine protease